MTSKNYASALVCGAFALCGCLADTDVVSVAKRGVVVTVTSKADDLDITKVVPNRGHCSPIDFRPKHLKFGEQMTLFTTCDPIEAEVTTDQGTVTVSWDR